MSDKIRLGIAGGGIGRRHSMAFQEIEGVELCAFADLSEETRQRMADTFGFGETYETCDEMILDGGIDAVVIATPTALHEKHISAALDAGLHTLCENPPAASAGEMSRIATTADLVGKKFMWARHQRFAPEIKEARKLIEQEALGNVYHGEARWHWAWWPFQDDNWRASKEQAGGALLDLSIHMLDSLWFAMGCPDPVEAMGSGFNHFTRKFATDAEDAAEDASVGMIRLKNGAALHFSTMYFSHTDADRSAWNSPERQEMALHGTDASLDMAKGMMTTVGKDKSVNVEPYAQKVELDEQFEAQAAEFISAIREDREPLNSAKQGLTLMKMLDALKLSAKEKRSVSIKAERTLDDLFSGM